MRMSVGYGCPSRGSCDGLSRLTELRGNDPLTVANSESLAGPTNSESWASGSDGKQWLGSRARNAARMRPGPVLWAPDSGALSPPAPQRA